MSRNPNPKKRMHFCPQYFHNPVHRIRVVLVGAGFSLKTRNLVRPKMETLP